MGRGHPSLLHRTFKGSAPFFDPRQKNAGPPRHMILYVLEGLGKPCFSGLTW